MWFHGFGSADCDRGGVCVTSVFDNEERVVDGDDVEIGDVDDVEDVEYDRLFDGDENP